jgi:hypothetical protein
VNVTASRPRTLKTVTVEFILDRLEAKGARRNKYRKPGNEALLLARALVDKAHNQNLSVRKVVMKHQVRQTTFHRHWVWLLEELGIAV